ncbi:MAG: histidine phosphatase family protein [Pseudomonadota bacterium]|nr:histidine phosphatase family protein [Pseudomonadota bacterium]
MILLSLLRHAKSDWAGGMSNDHARPLAPRGEKAAPRMGRHIASSGKVPDTILCSTAKRARQTLDLVLPELGMQPKVKYLDELYHAGPEAMMAVLRRLPPSCTHAMIVGHNPGMQALALDLARRNGSADLAAVRSKYPTAALALYQLEGNWPDLRKGSGKLLAFVTPRDLKGA